ncbi:MAG: adenylate/guanylate cyclase domain-containing protein [Candidatus Cloacimonetes bacterium]|nr:adenylate/guanylate cyclase domain-containing protein [Candidatus Cloacimonadota bacterium]
MKLKSITAISISLVVILFSYFFCNTNFGNQFEINLRDLIQKLSLDKNINSDSLDIIIVAIDDESFHTLDIQWPFPREYYIKLIENLNKAGAKLIVFDIEFSESYKNEIDSKLGLEAKRYNNVIFAGKIYQVNENNYLKMTLLPPNKDIIKNYSIWGVVNMINDNDGFIRRYPLFHKTSLLSNDHLFSLGLRTLQCLHQEDPDISLDERLLYFKDLKVNLSNQNDIRIHYYGPTKTFRHISFSSVIDDSTLVLPMEEYFPINDFYFLQENNVFKDKIVLIGATVEELKDNFLTPVNHSGILMPGVEIHANLIQMFIDNRFIKIFSTNLYYFLLLGLSLLLSFFFQKKNPIISSFVVVFLIVFNFVLVYYFFLNHSISITILAFPLNILLLYFVWLVINFINENKEKKIIKRTFQHYMAPTLVKELLKSPKNLKYGGEQKELTVLFSDIRSFTTYTESHQVHETVSMLKEYLTEMVNTIIDNQGILDKFVGDEVMALFNVPVNVENHPLKACICAMQMIDKLRELQQKWKSEGKEIINIGIGINTGQAVVGNLGSEQIFDYTAIGDTINLGARLEALNKNYQTSNNIIISEFTFEQVKEYVNVRYLDQVIVKGKSIPVKIYELISFKNDDISFLGV